MIYYTHLGGVVGGCVFKLPLLSLGAHHTKNNFLFGYARARLDSKQAIFLNLIATSLAIVTRTDNPPCPRLVSLHQQQPILFYAVCYQLCP